MAYNNNTPLATETIAATQQPIHDNYADIETLINVNHVGFNVADQGKHKFVTMPNQAAPGPLPLANEINMFSRQSTLTLRPEVCVSRNDGTVIEMTSSLNAAPGWAFTSSGLLLKWGSDTALAADYNAGGTVIAFPAAATIPVYAVTLSVFLTTRYPGGVDLNSIATLVNVAAVDFTVLASSRTLQAAPAGNVDFYYLALGTV